MAPLLTLAGTALLVGLAGLLGVTPLRGWLPALRGGLAAMFTVTGVTHFVVLRDDLIAMVPPALPRPDLLVTLTGVLELCGAAGLLYRRTVPWAAGGLTALLLAMLPANVHAALEGLTLGGEPVTPLVPRVLLQVVFGTATTAVLWLSVRERSRRGADPEGGPEPAWPNTGTTTAP
ncbi:putative membrane protein [Prauserella shujinwangii]|uniref:Putative membrane protein n=1 Tax=Prauserella shujinwangii TaxID=1453103 RepID=A0A2T0LQU5_9PSEU|nr:DoxX family membrane protein [Prauserella shujinwangii]PRX45879.1 putative membrane protein [Prauserella shujinwangii]